MHWSGQLKKICLQEQIQKNFTPDRTQRCLRAVQTPSLGFQVSWFLKQGQHCFIWVAVARQHVSSRKLSWALHHTELHWRVNTSKHEKNKFNASIQHRVCSYCDHFINNILQLLQYQQHCFQSLPLPTKAALHIILLLMKYQDIRTVNFYELWCTFLHK